MDLWGLTLNLFHNISDQHKGLGPVDKLISPEACCCNVYEAKIAICCFVIAGRQASGTFEFCEAALNSISQRIGDGVVRHRHFAACLRRDDRRCAALSNRVSDVVAVIASVSEEYARGR